jgi:hypothetical protein
LVGWPVSTRAGPLLCGAGFTIVLRSRLTAAIRASALPFSAAPASGVTAWSAMIVPSTATPQASSL